MGRIGILVLVLVLMVGLPFGLVVEWRVIGPLRRLIESITQFAQSPFDATAEWEQQNRGIIDEAHNALVSLQHRTQYELAQREKLAALGEAVAKINHDMRNVLSSAVLVSDILTASNDPKVARAAPLVNGAIDRAITLCQQLLGCLNTEKELNIADTKMENLLAECRRQLDLEISYDGPESLLVDKDQFFRLIFNLLDNAKKAGAGKAMISVWRTGRSTVMDISDDGPGLSESARAGLFIPFQSSSRGSTGLGLSIARDIAFAHGGNLKLSRSSEAGTEFRLRLPYHVIQDTIKKTLVALARALTCDRLNRLRFHVPRKENPCVLADLSDKCVHQWSPCRFCIGSSKMGFWHHLAESLCGFTCIHKIINN